VTMKFGCGRGIIKIRRSNVSRMLFIYAVFSAAEDALAGGGLEEELRALIRLAY